MHITKVIVFFLMCMPFIGNTQDNPAIEKNLAQLTKRLDLNAGQITQARAIYTAFFQELQEWRKNNAENKFEQRQEMETDRMKKIYAILNKEQQAKMAPMMEKRQAKMTEMVAKRKEKQADKNQLKQNPKQR